MIQPTITIPEYWALPKRERPRTFEDLVEKFLHREGISGFWRVTGTRAGTDEIVSDIWTPNAITDIGAQAAIADTFAPSAITTAPYNIICISTEAGSTTLTTALTMTTTTSLAVAALPNAIASGTTLKLDYGTGSEETCVTSALANAGATSISVVSFTPLFTHAIGKSVVPVALPTDNPSSSPSGAQYQTLVSGDFGSISGSGVGNRTRTITKKFLGSGTTAATYSWARLTNANPIVSGSVGASCIVPQAQINLTTDQTFQVIIKL